MITLSGAGALTYQWDNGVTDNDAFAASLGTTTYTVIGTNVDGCSDTDTVDVVAYALPVVEAGMSQTVCDGEMVTLSGSGASTYLWNNSVTDNVAFSPLLGTTTYTVTGTDGVGCKNTDTVDVTMNALPDNTTTTSGNTITANETGATYQWVDCDNGNSFITGETNASYTATTNGSYAVIVTKNGCSETSTCVNMSTVGVSDNAIDNQLSIYPNPTKDVVMVQLGTLKDVTLSVYSLTGKIVYQATNINEASHQFKLTSAAGFYIVNVTANGESQQFKLIKE
jgi:hypothetical protein